MPHPLHPLSDFHKGGYLYFLTCWTGFLVYCLYYQVDRFLKIYLSRRQNRQRKTHHSRTSRRRAVITPMDTFRAAVRPLEYSMTIPYVASMISVKHLIGMSLFIIANIICTYFSPFVLHPSLHHVQIPHWGILDRRMAYMGVVNWSFVIVLGTRNTLLTRMSGLTFEALMPFHRWVSRVGMLQMTVHALYRMYVGYRKHHLVYEAFFKTDEYVSGTLGYAGFILIFATSVYYFRRNFFRLFYYSHIIGFLCAMVGSFWHEWACIYFFTPPLLLWIADRILRSYNSWCLSASLIKLTHYQDKIVHATFEYSRLALFRPGQYLFAAFLTGESKHWLAQHADWYPMTVSDIFVRRKEADEGTSLTSTSTLAASLHIKALGDGTRELLQRAQDGLPVSLRVDGPYGPRLTFQEHRVVALFAVGIGITPALTILKDCVERPRRRSCVERVYLIWSASFADEVTPFSDYLQHCVTYPSSVQLDLVIHLTREPEETKCDYLEDTLGCRLVRHQRPDIPHILQEIANDNDHSDVWVHTCGSVPFMNTVINESIGHDFEFHHETFEF